MNRRITKSMAKKAAAKMIEKAYGCKIENARAKVDSAVEELVRKYLPYPVIACVNEYPEYFNYSMGANIMTILNDKGSTFTSLSISGKLTFKVPCYGTSIKVDCKDYDILLKLNTKLRLLEKESEKFGDQVYAALISLRTEKAVEKELPEALKYLEFPEVKAVPMPVFTGLREIIQSIKEG